MSACGLGRSLTDRASLRATCPPAQEARAPSGTAPARQRNSSLLVRPASFKRMLDSPARALETTAGKDTTPEARQ
jgi:hypothetical protein